MPGPHQSSLLNRSESVSQLGSESVSEWQAFPMIGLGSDKKKRTTAALVVYLIAIPKHAVFFVISLPCIISEWLLIIMVGFGMCLENHPQRSFENKTKCLYKPCLIIWTGHFVNSNSIIMSMIQLGKIKIRHVLGKLRITVLVLILGPQVVGSRLSWSSIVFFSFC